MQPCSHLLLHHIFTLKNPPKINPTTFRFSLERYISICAEWDFKHRRQNTHTDTRARANTQTKPALKRTTNAESKERQGAGRERKGASNGMKGREEGPKRGDINKAQWKRGKKCHGTSKFKIEKKKSEEIYHRSKKKKNSEWAFLLSPPPSLSSLLNSSLKMKVTYTNQKIGVIMRGGTFLFTYEATAETTRRAYFLSSYQMSNMHTTPIPPSPVFIFPNKLSV